MSKIKFKSIDKMKTQLEILTIDDLKMYLTTKELAKFEDKDAMAFIRESYDNKIFVDELLKKHDFYPISYLENETHKGVQYVYETGYILVNRKGILLCRKPLKGILICENEIKASKLDRKKTNSEVLRCANNGCKNIIFDSKGVPTRLANESNPEFCKYCYCDHSFNSDGVCEYCGES